jgi:lipid-A-disaccharide synthase
VTGQPPPNLDVFLVAGEASGDILGAGLMRALRTIRPVSFRGVGGDRMQEAGLARSGRIDDLPTIGIGSILARLPTVLRRLREVVEAIVAMPPDVLVLIDAPDFTHRVAARVRQRLPHLPIVKYVSPSVWIWRPGRARAMRPSIDLVLALLPFEPEVHRQLGGPDCLYVGHPLLDHLDVLRPSPEDAASRAAKPPLILALPGSRPSEIRRLCTAFGEALASVAARRGPLEVVLATLPHLSADISTLTAEWQIRPRIVTSEADKSAAFRRARAALAASGTVTLELALAGIPTVAAYRVPLLEELIFRAVLRPHPAIRVRSVILANIVLGEYAIPEFLQGRCTAANLAPALAELLDDTPARNRQIEAFGRLDAILGVGKGSPSLRAARAVVDLLDRRSSKPGGAAWPPAP